MDIKDLYLGHYYITGLSAQVIKLQQYDVILEKPWLYHANPTIDWRTNKLTFKYGSKTIIVKADSTQQQPLGCNSIFISRQQLGQAKTAKLFAIYLADIKRKESLL